MAKKKKPTVSEQSGDEARPRRIDDTPYDAAEPDRIRELERPQPAPRTDDEFVTDAELEAREIDLPSEEDE